MFWQVWVETADVPGTVRARIDRGEAQSWQFHESHGKEELLEAAKNSAISMAQELLAAKLEEARMRLTQLESAEG